MLDLIEDEDTFAHVSPAPQAGLFCRTGVRYEVALDVMGAMVAHFAEAIALERDRPDGDAGVVALYQALQAEIRSRRDALDPRDAAEIEATIHRFGPRARAVFTDLDETRQEQRRAQFLQIVEQTTLGESALNAVERAILAQVGCGAFDANEGVALLRRMAAQRTDLH